MSGHTPGPWRHDFMGYDSHTYYVRAEYRGRGGPNIHGSAGAIAKLPASKFHDQEANARLIAAAPMLLEALEQAVTSMQDTGYPNSHVAVRAARAAIAAATGGTK